MSVLKQLKREFGRTQAPAGASPSQAGGLGAAIEQLLAVEVERQVAEKMQQHQSPKLRKVLDGMNRPPQEPWRPAGEDFDAPTPAVRQNVQPARAIDVQFTRGSDERIAMVHVGDKHLKVQRDAFGRIVGMREED